MASCEVKAHILKNVRFDNGKSIIEEKWDYQDFLNNEKWFNNWISFDCLLYDKRSDFIYCGLANFSTDIFYVFDRKKEVFHSLDFKKIANPYDAKFHRSLVMDKEGKIYGAIALLHDIDRQFEAPGGSIIRYDPSNNKLEKLCIPLPYIYIQAIAIDKERKIIYGTTLTPERLFRYDLTTRKCRDLGIIGNSMQICQAHLPVVDDEGNFWSSWGVTRAFASTPGKNAIRLFKYSPHEDKIHWFSYGIPKIDERDSGYIDVMLNGKDGYIYIGGVSGSLTRLNPQTGETELLGKPCPGKRLSALALGPDGLIYGIGGNENKARVFAFNRKKKRFIDLGPVYDAKLGIYAYQIHDMVITEDLVIFAGENDNPERASYLWECRVK